ncbi:MAG: hypothetical protein QXM53_06775 [Thermofilaceae archaeon]
MTPKTKPQTKTENQTQAFSKAGVSQRGAEYVVASGRGWAVVRRAVGDREFLDLRVRASFDRSVAQILEEAIPKIQQLQREGKIQGPVGYTQWIGKKPVRYLIFQDGLRVKLSDNLWAGSGFLRRLCELVSKFSKEPQDGEEEVDEFVNNIPESEE